MIITVAPMSPTPAPPPAAACQNAKAANGITL